MDRRNISLGLFAAAAGSVLTATEALAQTCTTAACYPQTPAEATAGVTPANISYPPGDPRRYGAVGNGSTPDSAAFNKALSVAQTVTVCPGLTYVVTGLVASVPNQLIEAYGATLLQESSTNTPMLTVSATGVKVRGGVWDGNSVNQSGGSGVQYSHQAVALNADDCSVEDAISQNSYGIGFASHGANHARIAKNKVIGAQLHAIYTECVTASVVGVQIEDNAVDTTAYAAANGIFLASQSTGETITAISVAAAAVVTVNTKGSNPFTVNGVIAFSAIGGMTQINGQIATITAIGGTSGAYTATTNISSIGYSAFTSGGTVTFISDKFLIRGNVVAGSTTNPATTIGITSATLGGGVIHGNNIVGYGMAISADATTNTIISNNRGTGQSNTSYGYGIECNNGGNTVVGNYMKGQNYGLIVSSSALNLDHMVVVGNTFDSNLVTGVLIQQSAAGTNAQYGLIADNFFRFDLAATQRIGVTLTGDCRFTKITGNQFQGPASSVAGAMAVFLDTLGVAGTGGNVEISGNKFAGWANLVGLYAATSWTYNDISFCNNDCTKDIGVGGAAFIQLQGSAVYGANVTQMWNPSAVGVIVNYLDKGAGLFLQWSNRFSTPNSNVAGAIGSLYINTNGGSGTTLWVKESGSNTTTGWVGK